MGAASFKQGVFFKALKAEPALKSAGRLGLYGSKLSPDESGEIGKPEMTFHSKF